MIKIPTQLQNPTFRFCLVKAGEKAPFEKAWQKKGYSYDSPKLLEHIRAGGNYGVIGGYGNLRILDIDDPQLAQDFEKKLPTFTIKTGSGGRHFYFTSLYNKNHVLANGAGELRANNYQCVGAGSTHPNGNKYEVVNNSEIADIATELLLEILKPYLKEEQTSMSDTETTQERDTSRSAQEMREIIKLILKGYSKATIFKRMMFYAKWSAAPEQYKELTFKKAHEHVKKTFEEKEPEIEANLEIISDEELMTYQPKEQKWLIENQIPDNEIGLLVGKRGERKTFTALYQALCLASGLNCFDDKVPEPKKIVFVTEEDSQDSLAQRVKALKCGLGITKELPIKYLSFNGLKLDRDDTKYKKFKELLGEYKPDLIIIDALQRVVTFEVDKDNRAISELFTSRIRPLMKELGGSWLFVSHLRKTQGNYKILDELDEVRGGSELTNYCRFVLMCQAPRYQTKTDEGADMIVFKALKMSNSSLPEAKVVSFAAEGDSIKVSYEGIPSEVLAGEVQCAKAITEWLFNNQITSFKTKEINDASEEIGFKKTLISQGLKLLIKQGTLRKVKKGVYEVLGKEQEQLQ